MKKTIAIMSFCALACLMVCVGTHVSFSPEKKYSGTEVDVGTTKVEQLCDFLPATSFYTAPEAQDFVSPEFEQSRGSTQANSFNLNIERSNRIYPLNCCIKQCRGGAVAAANYVRNNSFNNYNKTSYQILLSMQGDKHPHLI